MTEREIFAKTTIRPKGKYDDDDDDDDGVDV